jgi:hypothetical protein
MPNYSGMWTMEQQFQAIGSGTWAGNPLGSQANPAPSVAALRSAGITTDGAYYFTMSGQTFQSYVRFNYIDGGDWYLILKVFNQGDMSSGNAFWQNATLYNETDFNLTSGTWSKYASWLYVPFNRVMMVMTQGGTAKVPPIMIWNTQKTSFYSVISAITPSNGSGDRCDSTDPAIGNNVTYWNMPMKSGTAFTDAGGAEDIIQAYGIGSWANNSANSTTAEGFSSVGRAGAWIGAPLDESGHTFNNVSNNGSDSGFGFGASAGNPAKTTSAGYNEWTLSSSTNTLPGYVWVR